MALNAPLAHFWLADLHVLCGPRTHAKPCSSVPVAFSPGQRRPGLPKFRVMRSETCDDTRVSGCRDRFWIGRTGAAYLFHGLPCFDGISEAGIALGEAIVEVLGVCSREAGDREDGKEN